jgi:hypothetical protein
MPRVRGREPLIHDGPQVGAIGREQGHGIQPEAGEDLGAEQAVGAQLQGLEVIATADEPVDAIGG